MDCIVRGSQRLGHDWATFTFTVPPKPHRIFSVPTVMTPSFQLFRPKARELIFTLVFLSKFTSHCQQILLGLLLTWLLPTFLTVVHISLDYGISPPFSLLLPWTPVGSSQISKLFKGKPVCCCSKASQIPSLFHSKASNGFSCCSEWKSQFSRGPHSPHSLHPLPSPLLSLPSRHTGLPVCPAHSECSCLAVLDLHFPDCFAQTPMWHFPKWHLLRAPFPILIYGFPPYLGCPCALSLPYFFTIMLLSI